MENLNKCDDIDGVFLRMVEIMNRCNNVELEQRWSGNVSSVYLVYRGAISSANQP